MKVASFNELRKIIHNESGIVIGENKRAMVTARLSKRIRSLGLDDVDHYLEFLDKNLESEMVELLDVFSTNVTRFYREDQHFSYMTDFLRGLIKDGAQKIRIWCAASSTGEEPYTLAITAKEVMRESMKNIDLKILATDISPSVLQHADQGVYMNSKVAPVPNEYVDRYFDRRGDKMRVKDSLRSMIVFKRLNLMEQPYPMRGPLDLIFCRNVMIYFNVEDRTRVVEEFARLLAPHGRLVVGLSESLNNCSHVLVREGASIYKRSDA